MLWLQQNSSDDGVDRAQAEAGQENPAAAEPLLKPRNAHGASHAVCVRSGRTLVRGPAVTTKRKDTRTFIRKL